MTDESKILTLAEVDDLIGIDLEPVFVGRPALAEGLVDDLDVIKVAVMLAGFAPFVHLGVLAGFVPFALVGFVVLMLFVHVACVAQRAGEGKH